jgi:hypothetical protein
MKDEMPYLNNKTRERIERIFDKEMSSIDSRKSECYRKGCELMDTLAKLKMEVLQI